MTSFLAGIKNDFCGLGAVGQPGHGGQPMQWLHNNKGLFFGHIIQC
jgi:hypothetical protein